MLRQSADAPENTKVLRVLTKLPSRPFPMDTMIKSPREEQVYYVGASIYSAFQNLGKQGIWKTGLTVLTKLAGTPEQS